jgi:hypothetical protein
MGHIIYWEFLLCHSDSSASIDDLTERTVCQTMPTIANLSNNEFIY